MNTENYSDDEPINKKDEDKFSRMQFSERVAQVIAKRRDSSSIVIGLYGRWGDGKTSVLNFIEQSLEFNEDVICIKFNPWRFGNEDQLLIGFFDKIAESLGKKLGTKADKIKDIGKKVIPSLTSLIPISGSKEIGEIATNFISVPDVEEFKRRVEELLITEKKRVLIIIDDVDRLDKVEIHALFRLIKLTADFKYTSYILAFDKDIVASSLQDRYSNSQGNSGEAFLEKIIQVPLNLPYINKETLRDFCIQGVDEALSLANIELTQEQAQEFANNYDLAFERCITTPRKAKLYGNTLLFSLPILKGEINPIDFMLIEGIRVFYPKLYELVRDNKKLFAPISPKYRYTDHDKKLLQELIEDSISTLQSNEKNGLIELLKYLFPKLVSIYGRIEYVSDWNKWEQNQRICCANYFSRYFSYSLQKNEVSDIDFEHLMDDITEWGEPFSIKENPIDAFFENNDIGITINKLRNRVNDFDQHVLKNLSIAISQSSEKIPTSQTLLFSTYQRSMILISDLILKIDKEEQVNVAKRCLNNIPKIEYQVRLFIWLYHEDNENPKLNCFSSIERKTIGEHLGKDIYSKIKDMDVTISYPDLISRIFWILSEYYNLDTLNSYVSSIVSQDYTAVHRILEGYVPTFTSLTDQKTRKEDLDEASFNNLSKSIDVSILYESIKTHHDKVFIPQETYPQSNGKKRDSEQRVKQFLWWYRKKIMNDIN